MREKVLTFGAVSHIVVSSFPDVGNKRFERLLSQGAKPISKGAVPQGDGSSKGEQPEPTFEEMVRDGPPVLKRNEEKAGSSAGMINTGSTQTKGCGKKGINCEREVRQEKDSTGFATPDPIEPGEKQKSRSGKTGKGKQGS